jgi:heme/copper-type cytochrome/quinol oxidase subunit 2
MKYHPPLLILLLIALVAWAGCTSSQQATTVERDGSSIEKAVVVNSIREEYQWVQHHYPNSRVTRQALIQPKGKHYDELTFVTPSGETKKAYFDINSFFGKF